MSAPIANRYEFVYLFDVTRGNPNGDPDAGNLPRLDPETNQGLVTDVALKRKIRNYVSMEKEGQPGYAIYMQERSILNNQHKLAWDALSIQPDKDDGYSKLPRDKGRARELTSWMCQNFFDVRTFGAVMTTKINAGQVRGPVQLGFASSIDPVVPLEVAITRVAVTNEKDKKERTMGRKYILPYGLYRVHGFISAKLAERTGFSDSDLELLWRSLGSLFDHDRSASHGEMAARNLLVFKHENPLGNAPAHVLFDKIRVNRSDGQTDAPARRFTDYKVGIDRDGLPAGVTLSEML